MFSQRKLSHARRWSGLIAGLWLVLGGTAMTARAEVVYPPGLRVGIDPPKGMVFDPRTSRFEDPVRNANLIILDLPGSAYWQLERVFFSEARAPGVTLEKRENFPFESGFGFFVTLRLKHEGAEFKKWILLASSAANPGGEIATVVSLQVPADSLAAYPETAVRAAFRSITFRPPPNEERLAMLPFRLGELAGFRVAEVQPLGVVLTEGPLTAPGRPEITVSAGNGEARTADEHAELARKAMLSIPVRDLAIISAEPLRIGGSLGYEIRATATGRDGRPISLVQWMRFFGNGYLRILAGAPTDDWQNFFPRFRAVRDGIALSGPRGAN